MAAGTAHYTSHDMTDPDGTPFDGVTEEQLRAAFDAQSYVADDDLVTTVLLALRLGKPLLVEGEPGAGKTELAKVLAGGFDTELVRLQCYEGLTAANALYEWNYTKQLLAVQSGADDGSVFGSEYLLERPLLRALRTEGDRPPVLLIDEVDRADEEFEALLLEVLSDFQVSVPELGTIAADTPPVVVITSNRTRALSDARRVPELDTAVAAELCAMTDRLREEPLRKPPGAAETIDWARAVAALRADNGAEPLSPAEVHDTLGCLLKEAEDVERVDEDLIATLVDAAAAAREEVSP